MTLGHTRTVDRRTARTPQRVAGALLAGVATVALATPAIAADDPLRSQQWALELIGAPEAWAVGRGAGSTIAIIDSGIDLSHEDLVPNVLPGRSFVSPTAQDDDGHGTHVAGTAAGVADNGLGISGVAPEAKLLAVKVLTPDGGTVGDVAAGVRYAADAGATVINLSLGPEVPLVFSALDTSLADAIQYAWSKGVVCVLAAGNNGLPISDHPDLPAIVVTAVDRDDRKAVYATSVGGARWGLAAPGGAGAGVAGDDILSTYWIAGKQHQYAQLAGTSMAVPHVSGAAAVLRGLGLSPQETVDRLLATATDLGSPGRDSTYGSGRLDLHKAVQGLGPPPSATGAPAAEAPSPTTSSAPGPVRDEPTAAESDGALGGPPLPPPPARTGDDDDERASPLAPRPKQRADRDPSESMPVNTAAPADEVPPLLAAVAAIAAIAAGTAVHRRARHQRATR
jgi:subtilisin family serine protease